MKFKNRVSLFNTIAAAIITVLVFIVIYIVVNKTAYSHLDNDILLEKEEVFKYIKGFKNEIIIHNIPEWDEVEHKAIEVNPIFLQIVDAEGTVIFHSENLLNDQFLFNPNNQQENFYNSELSGQKIRLGQFPIKNEKGKIVGQLTIAVSQKELFVILNNLLLVLLISFPLILIVQYVASSFAASKAIRPVHQLIKTASGISESNMNTRLTLPTRKDELYELANTINELVIRIEKSMTQQKQFTGDASHEIRTPLAAIRGTLEVLIRKQRDPEFYEDKIRDIINQVDRVDMLLDQLLHLARIESGVIFANKESIELLPFIMPLSEKWIRVADVNNIKIRVDIPKEAAVFGDKMFLELMLDNLVTNAIKYGNFNGNVFLIWDAALKTLSVKDDGIGISEEHLPNIFDNFYRTDESRSSTIQGNGLGLSIVKKLAELQQIKIDVKSQLGKGSIFTLQFTT
ncbi:HAMP domain-containing sensor histidine kinase [Yeosuana marina]|uniref:HAMP domain-containing sensor histidine kinase n=1 Tax=Yeosuana marina TaxID=1565536 RepID=UPI0030C839D4